MDETEQVGGNENPRLSAEELAGMRDFWEVYDAHYDEVSAAREELADDPEIGPVLQAAPAELQAEEDRQSREIMGAAICDGAWHAYLAHLRTVGGTYGEAGLGFAGWFAAVGALRTHMGPRLRTAYGDSQERLLAADRGMNAFVDLAMAAIGEEYLAAREQRIGEQQEAIRELSTPVLELRPGLLILPLIGLLDSDRARRLTEELLQGIAKLRARAVVLDVTGVRQSTRPSQTT